jgi:hypothetical protein
MSNTLAFTFPAEIVPGESRREPTPSHIEIVATRSQRRARPRIVYALVAVGGLFVILMAQLLMSILLSNGAYQISALQAKQKNLVRDQQTLSESLHILQSPQNLAVQAESLGMVINSNGSGRIMLSTGAVLNPPTAAGAASATDAGAGALVPNSLLVPGLTATQQAAVLAAGSATAPGGKPAVPPSPGAPSARPGTGSVTSGAIPAPTTH